MTQVSTPPAVRPVKGLSWRDIEAGVPATEPPTFEEVDPAELLVDDSYQRNLSERSINLIRRIVAGWDWRRFKPPVCARTERGLEIIDGQHTAIAAASHPKVARIPVMVVVAAERESRARAFIGHNRDRLNITPMQLHYAAAAAGDEDALTINQVCERAGVKILKASPGNGVFKPGETVAVKAIGALINRRGAMRAREILQCLIEARRCPISAGDMKAVERLLHDDEYAGEISGSDVAAAFLALGDEADREAAVFAATHKVPQWRALAVILFRKGKRRGRRRAD